uniref:Uncharacterized protein n=1 Tax=Salmo trutta TaxID=8032 RepID=A0A674AY05_SALTR
MISLVIGTESTERNRCMQHWSFDVLWQGWATLMGVGATKNLISSWVAAVARRSAYPHPYPHMQSEPFGGRFRDNFLTYITYKTKYKTVYNIITQLHIYNTKCTIQNV